MLRGKDRWTPPPLSLKRQKQARHRERQTNLWTPQAPKKTTTPNQHLDTTVPGNRNLDKKNDVHDLAKYRPKRQRLDEITLD